jgi:hypothetical protein
MGFFNKQRRKDYMLQRLTRLAFYREHQLAGSRVMVGVSLLILGYCLFFDRSVFVELWILPVLAFLMLFWGLWGSKHYK